MTVSQRMLRLVSLLNTRTDLGEIQWAQGFADDTFRTQVGSNYVVLGFVNAIDRDDGIEVEVKDDFGTTIDSITTIEARKAAEPLYNPSVEIFELYDKARRSALNSDQVLDDIIGLLENGS